MTENNKTTTQKPAENSTICASIFNHSSVGVSIGTAIFGPAGNGEWYWNGFSSNNLLNLNQTVKLAEFLCENKNN